MHAYLSANAILAKFATLISSLKDFLAVVASTVRCAKAVTTNNTMTTLSFGQLML